MSLCGAVGIPIIQTMYYEKYVREQAEEAFDFEKADIDCVDANHNSLIESHDEELNQNLFDGAMREMIAHLHERSHEVEGSASMSLFLDPDNVEKIHIVSKGISAPNVIVEYGEFPDWFVRENAKLREFYWHPNPALTGIWSAAYFQVQILSSDW